MKETEHTFSVVGNKLFFVPDDKVYTVIVFCVYIYDF